MSLTRPTTPFARPGPPRSPPPPPPRSRGWAWKFALCALVAVLAVGLGAAGLAAQLFLRDVPALPDRSALWAAGRPPGITFLDWRGNVIARRGPRHGERVALADLPPHVPRAFLAIEDKRFYEHGALDLRGIARAAVANQRAGRAVEGGSTLTQQLVRTLLLKPDKTLERKVHEAVLAYRLEQVLTKDEILELYLNRIYFGDRAYGLSAAARTYFDKQAKDLTVSEAALLAALPKAPSRLAPTDDSSAAWTRAKLILSEMARLGWITPAQAAQAAPPVIKPPPVEPEGDLAWFLDAAMVEAQRLAGDRSPDLVVRLTVDPALQSQAVQVVQQAIAKSGRRLRARQGALIALAPDGAVRAMVGGVDYNRSRFNRAWQAKRQPGSSFKPLVWATALERGVDPYDTRSGSAVRVGSWTPQNYGGGYAGEVTLDQALRRSLNTVSVRLTREVGPRRVAELAHRFGLAEIPDRPGPSIALGAYEVTLAGLTGAYQVFQNGGGHTAPYLISQITNARGDQLYFRGGAPAPVYGQYQAAQMVRMMEGVIASGTGRRAQLDRPAAGKTGTSQNHRDAWFVGFTPDWAVGVWVGNDDNRPMAGVTGGELPAVIWRRFMTLAHRGLPASDFTWMPALPDAPPAWSGALDASDEGLPDEAVDGVLSIDRPGGGADGAPPAEGEARIWLPSRPDEPQAPSRPDSGPSYIPAYGAAVPPTSDDGRW